MDNSNNVKYLFVVAAVVAVTTVGVNLFISGRDVSVDVLKGRAAGSMPSAKAAFSLGDLIDLGALASTNGAATTDTGYVTVMQSYIKAPQGKELSADVAIQCGINTDTSVKSKGGAIDIAKAKGEMSIRVKGTHEDGTVRYFEPSEAGTAPDGGVLGVTYCSRLQQLEAQFAGLNCTADLTTGVVTCTDPEMMRLLLETLNANAFNFLLADVKSGVWKVEVQARAKSSAQLGGSGLGSASANAFIGLGSTRIETVRMIRGADTSPVAPAELQ